MIHCAVQFGIILLTDVRYPPPAIGNHSEQRPTDPTLTPGGCQAGIGSISIPTPRRFFAPRSSPYNHIVLDPSFRWNYIRRMGDSLSKMDLETLRWDLTNESKLDRLLRYTEYTEYVHQCMRPVVEALLDGSTLNIAARMGGFTKSEVEQLLEWGRQGHPVWSQFRDEVLEADGQSIGMVEKTVQQLAIEGNKWAINLMLKRKDAEQRAIEQGEMAARRGGGGATVVQQQVQIRSFKRTEDGDVVDAEYEEG